MSKKFRVTAPDGHVLEVTGPDDATEEQAVAQAQQLYKPKEAAHISDDRTAAEVGDDQARAAIKGMAQPILHPIDTLTGIAKSLNPAAPHEGTLVERVKALLSPVTTPARGLGALIAPNHIQAPSRQEWEQAAGDQGALLSTSAIGEGIGRGASALKDIPPGTPDSLMTRAENLRTTAAAPQPNMDIPLSEAGVIKTAATGAVNATRLPRAALYEKVAQALAKPGDAPMGRQARMRDEAARIQSTAGRASDAQPWPDGPPVPQPPGVPSFIEDQLQRGREAETPDALYTRQQQMRNADVSAEPWRTPAEPYLTPLKPPTSPPRFVENQLELARGAETPEQQFARQRQQSDMDASYGREAPSAAPIAQPRPQPQSMPPPLEGGNAITRIEQGIAPSGEERAATALRVAPKLAEDPLLTHVKGAIFDKQLFEKYTKAKANLTAAEMSVPRGTTVPKRLITEPLLEAIEKQSTFSSDPDLLANNRADVILGNWYNKLDKLPEEIPFDELRKFRQKLDHEIQVHGGWKETATSADRMEMEALRKVSNTIRGSLKNISKPLDMADAEFGVAADAMGAAGLDWETGRRLSKVGKAPKSPMADRVRQSMKGTP